MDRIRCGKRGNWQEKLEEIGFTFHSMGGGYWNEGVCYEFSGREIDHLEEVTGDLHDICMAAAGHIIGNDLIGRLGIPVQHHALIKESWENSDRSIYGRFDLAYNGRDEPKLLEYNADTPTSLFESSVVQWLWLQDLFPEYDQFNSIHEKLTDVFRSVSAENTEGAPLYFTCVNDYPEDFVTVEYMRDVASQCGLDARHIYVEDIGYNADTWSFVDLEGSAIRQMFKLYPWEWLLADDFGCFISRKTLRLFEPAWKMVLSNKGLLPVLWEMFPDHPNLLMSYFEPDRIKGDFVKKPLLSREGANISLLNKATGREETTDGTYGSEGFIYQKMETLPNFDGNYAVVGSWVINNMPAGIGIREDDTPITRNTSRFVPHYFKP